MPSETRRLSVAMIARDAEPTIAAALDSVRKIADEIIVADTGSLDRTRQIAVARATQVVDVPWTDDFAAARNACLASCTGEWILWLDASERTTIETAEQIRRFVDEGADPEKVYLLMVQLPPSGEHGMSEQVGRIRLMPNRPSLRFLGRVRESLHSALVAAGMRVELKPWQIQRGAEDQDPAIERSQGDGAGWKCWPSLKCEIMAKRQSRWWRWARRWPIWATRVWPPIAFAGRWP